ncbi:MAG: hypothetical protein FJX75_16710, partial [Armatimonadetes bacterium]|nr:hypothetical protein [Armatimonadota bacterium]
MRTIPATCLATLLSLGSAALAADLVEAHPWVSFEGLATSPLTFETKIPAESAFADGPNGTRALAVRIADLARDEKACAAHLELPPLDARRNALRLWVRGSANTKRLEIVVRTSAGNFATDLPLTPEWRQVTLSPQNTTPWFSEGATRLDVSQATQLRFCIGLWQGHSAGPHEFGIGPVEAIYSPLFAAGPPPEERDAKGAPVPLQPFTVELLDMNRGQWEFIEPLGGRLALPGPVVGYAFPTGDPTNLRIAYLCCDPEFPDDPAHGTLKVVSAAATEGDAQCFRIDEPYLSCGVALRPETPGLLRCELRDIALGPATTGDRYVAALYLLVGGKLHAAWLAPDSQAVLQVRLLTNRVGNVFVGDEPCRISLVGMNPQAERTRTFALRAMDYLTRQTVWRDRLTCHLSASSATTHEFTIPLKRFGIFEVAAESEDGLTATLRICRIPRPRNVNPEQSSVGINLFQQQVW